MKYFKHYRGPIRLFYGDGGRIGPWFLLAKEVPMGQVTNENVATVVRYQAPTPEQIERHENLSCAAETMIQTILKNVPDCADRSAAIRHVRDAKMTASAAVALNGLI